MFDIRDMIEILEDDYIKPSKKEKFLRKVLSSEDFLGYLFNPPKDMTVEATREKLYNELTTISSLKLIQNTLYDYGADAFPRTTAVFLYSICQAVVDKCNSDDEKISSAYRRGDMTRREKDDAIEKIERRFVLVTKINEYCNKIVKGDTKRILRQTDLPKDCISAVLKCVPEVRYLKKDKVGYYLNVVTAEIYSSIERDDSYYMKNVDWSPLFRFLFGRDNEVSVAMYLTLEGTNRISKDWKNIKTISNIWDSLTAYALNVLEYSGAEERAHMLDLYAKIVSSMNDTNRDDLRVDLRKLDEDMFPNLSRSVRSISDKISDAVKQIKINDGETKEVTKLS